MLVKVRCTLNLIWRKSNLSRPQAVLRGRVNFTSKLFLLLNLSSIACLPVFVFECCSHLRVEKKRRNLLKMTYTCAHIQMNIWCVANKANLPSSHRRKAIKIIIYIHIEFKIKNCLSGIPRYLSRERVFLRDFCEKNIIWTLTMRICSRQKEKKIHKWIFFCFGCGGNKFAEGLCCLKAFSSFFMKLWEQQVIEARKNFGVFVFVFKQSCLCFNERKWENLSAETKNFKEEFWRFWRILRKSWFENIFSQVFQILVQKVIMKEEKLIKFYWIWNIKGLMIFKFCPRGHHLHFS